MDGPHIYLYPFVAIVDQSEPLPVKDKVWTIFMDLKSGDETLAIGTALRWFIINLLDSNPNGRVYFPR